MDWMGRKNPIEFDNKRGVVVSEMFSKGAVYTELWELLSERDGEDGIYRTYRSVSHPPQTMETFGPK